MEVRIADVEADKLEVPIPSKGTWAAVWMLREIEVRNMKTGQVRRRAAERPASHDPVARVQRGSRRQRDQEDIEVLPAPCRAWCRVEAGL